MIHKIMAHPNLEVIQHIKKAVKGLKINKELAELPTSIECLTYTISKSIQIISRHSDSKDVIRTSPRESWSWDLLYETSAYNSNQYCSYFQDLHTGFNIIYTYTQLKDTYNVIIRAFNLIKNQYQYTPKHIHLDKEHILQIDWKHLISELGIQEHCSAPDSLQ